MRLALSDGVACTRGATRGSRTVSRGRVVVRATAEGEANDVLGGLLDSLNSAVQSTPAPAPAPAPAAPPAPAPVPPPPTAVTPTPTPAPPPVESTQPNLPSIESLAQKLEIPSSKAASVAAPTKAADANPLQPLLDALTSAEEAVETAFDDTAEAIIDNLNSLALPPSLQNKVDMITTEYADVKGSFDEAPEVYLFLFSLLLAGAGYAYFRIEYGGFSGIYKPTELVEALTKEDNIIVVDIRPEDEQDSKGVLDLRRNARGKAVSLPLLEVPDAVKGDVRNRGALQRKLSAALVCSLANVNAFTKIVLMDTRGGTTKALARDISNQGYRAYCLKGGYTLWRRTGLATKKGTYDVSAADLLADKGEELGEAATFTAKELKKPQNAALVVLALVGLGTTVTYPHQSFQFFGFLGLQLTVILKALSYERPADALAALNESSRLFAGCVATKATSAGSNFSKLSGPAAAAGAAVKNAAAKAGKKQQESEAKADVVKEEVKAEDKPSPTATMASMFSWTKASADKPAPVMPAVNAPSPSKPAASAPETSKSIASTPDLSKPAASASAPSKPAASAPVTSKSTASTPDLSKPAASMSAPSKPAASAPETSKSTASKPNLSKPAASPPETSKSTASKPNLSKPAASAPETSKSTASTTASNKPAGASGAISNLEKSLKKEASGSKKDKWPASVAQAAAEAAAIAQDVPKPVVEIVDRSKGGDEGKKIANGNAKDVKSEKS